MSRGGARRRNKRPHQATASHGLLDGLLGYHLRRAQAAVFDDFMRTMAGEGITPGQFGVLALIDGNDGLNQSTLARALGIERSTLVAVIDKLQARGLVERRESALDKRSYALGLTAAGRDLFARLRDRVRIHEERIAADLEPGEAAQLVGLLSKVARPARLEEAGDDG